MPRIARYLAPLLLLPFAACQTIVATQPASCSEFIPPQWKQPVGGYPLPNFVAADSAETDLEAAREEAKAWQGFGVGQTGQLSKANNRQSDTVHIFETCERRANAARPRKKILGVF